MRRFAITSIVFSMLFVSTVYMTSCTKEQTKPETNLSESSYSSDLAERPSSNASWTGWANANKAEIQNYQNRILEVSKILSRDPVITAAFKQYFTAHQNDPNFDFTLNFTEIMNLCQTNNIGIPSIIATPAVACGLITDASKVGELINEMKSKTIGGRTVEAQIFIPYYDTSYYETPNWNGAIVNRIIVNDIFAKQNVGVPVYTWNGNGYAQSYYQHASKLDEYIHWIVGIDVVDGLRPIARCSCFMYGGGVRYCSSSQSSSVKCGWSVFGSTCSNASSCDEKLGITPIL